LAAVTNLYRLTSQWEEFLIWEARHGQELQRHPQFLPVLLRARGETGDLPGLIEMYDRQKEQIGRLIPAASRDLCRLMLFVFAGKRNLAEPLLPAVSRFCPVQRANSGWQQPIYLPARWNLPGANCNLVIDG